MGDYDDGNATISFSVEHVDDALRIIGVKVSSGFISQNDIWAPHYRPRNSQSLTFTTGENSSRLVQAMRKPDLLDSIFNKLEAIVPRSSRSPQR
ncbi:MULTISPECIES: hypothetical protein [Brevibacterium]|uniref:hypothetical protein n=1 Tax=Brevibacterium sp. S22 TaxID=2483794 RepID=UPI001F105425|nr:MULTISPECIES: hypothetical protein [Brevibacterium]